MFEVLESFWSRMLTLNSSQAYLQALLLFVILFVVFKIFDSYIIHVLKKGGKKTKTNLDDALIGFLEKISWVFFVYLSLYLALMRLTLPVTLNAVLDWVLLVFVIFYASRGLINLLHHLLDGYKDKRKRKGESASESMIGVLKVIASLTVWVVALLMLLSNLGVEITPLIAGLGVGGIAIGLALQNILGDLFSAFAIYFDKPFQEGDFIIVGDDMGVVKHIGIKTTRIQALGGQELVMSNSELTSSRVNNYKKMNTRRVVFSFGVEYGTSAAQLQKIKKLTAGIIDKEEHATLDRVHFKNFGDSSLNFEVVYYVDSNDYNLFMDVQESINLELKKKVEALGVDFAFPSRTIYMKKG